MAIQSKAHINKGLIIAALLIIVDIVIQLIHQKFALWVFTLNTVLLALGIIISIVINTRTTDDTINFSNLFGYGFKVAVVAVCIYFLYTVLSVYVIFPRYVTEVYEQKLTASKNVAGFSVDQAKEQKEMAIKVISNTILSGVVMINLAIGIAASLVGAIVGITFFKNKN